MMRSLAVGGKKREQGCSLCLIILNVLEGKSWRPSFEVEGEDYHLALTLVD